MLKYTQAVPEGAVLVERMGRGGTRWRIQIGEGPAAAPLDAADLFALWMQIGEELRDRRDELPADAKLSSAPIEDARDLARLHATGWAQVARHWKGTNITANMRWIEATHIARFIQNLMDGYSGQVRRVEQYRRDHGENGDALTDTWATVLSTCPGGNGYALFRSQTQQLTVQHEGAVACKGFAPDPEHPGVLRCTCGITISLHPKDITP